MNATLNKTARGLVGTMMVGGLVVAGCRGNFTSFSGDFLDSGVTDSFFTASQIDPKAEDTAGPQFVVTGDLDGDGMTDVVSAWNQSQPVQIHLQRISASGKRVFETVTLASSVPTVAVSGLAVADFDQDGHTDVAVMMKSTYLTDAGCLDSETPNGDGLSGLIMIYLGPTDVTQINQSLAWREAPVEVSRLQGNGDADGLPEDGGFSAMAMGDIDMDGDIDLVAAWNSACGDNGTADVVVFTNLGGASVRDSTWAGATVPSAIIHANDVAIKDVSLGDVDGDGDLDIVATFPTASSMNVRWFRNPTVDIEDDFHISDGQWQTGTVGQVATGADVCTTGDIDGDGVLDVLVRSTNGLVLQWFKGPGTAARPEAATLPVANVQWQVYTIAEFKDRTPQAVAIVDLNGDGQVEVVAAAGGALAWFNATTVPSVFNQWDTNVIIDDEPSSESTNDLSTTDPNVSPTAVAGTTLINTIHVADVDGDGRPDLLVTLDREGLSGLSNDALAWFRNTGR